jgi:hypothetical protein
MIRVQSLGLFLCSLLFLALAPALCAGQQPAPDLDGRNVNPLTSNAGHLVVLVFLRENCPITGRYAPTISELHQKDARFYLTLKRREWRCVWTKELTWY